MIETGELLGIAQIAVALAGFSAIIGVLGSRSGRYDVRVDALRLQAMLESSLIVALFALLPVLVARFGLPTDTSWRICGAVWLLIQIPLEFVYLRRTKNMPDMTLARRNVNTINWCLSLASDAIMVGVVLGLAGSHAGAFYLASLFMLLVMSGLLFVQFAASTFVPAD